MTLIHFHRIYSLSASSHDIYGSIQDADFQDFLTIDAVVLFFLLLLYFKEFTDVYKIHRFFNLSGNFV